MPLQTPKPLTPKTPNLNFGRSGGPHDEDPGPGSDEAGSDPESDSESEAGSDSDKDEGCSLCN